MANRSFRGLNQPTTLDLGDLGNPQTPRPPRRQRNGLFWGGLSVLIIVCLIVSAGGIYLYNNLPAEPTTPTNDTPYVPAPQPGGNDGEQQNVPQIPPAGAEKQTITVCLFYFGPYFSVLQAAVADNSNRPYILNVLPLGFTDLDGNVLISDDEGDQARWMQDGTCDIILTTSDTLRLNPQMGKWITDVGVSDGADKTRALLVGRVGCPGKPIARFNDLEGCVIAVSPNAAGQFQVLSVMSAAGMSPNSVTWLTGEYDTSGMWHDFSVEDACQAFADGKSDAVAGWIPCIDEGIGDPSQSQILVNSTWLRNLKDIIVVSHKANAEKPDAVFWFLVDWFGGLKVQQENLKAAGEAIASWTFTFNGIEYNTNDWTYVFPESAENDMHLWLDTYGLASLDSNLLLANQTDILDKRFVDFGAIWAYGGVPLGTLNDVADLRETKYLGQLATYVTQHPELRPRSGTTLPNTSYTPFQVLPSAALDGSQLVNLPTAFELNCVSQLSYKAGEDFLRPNTPDYDNLVVCSKSLQQLMAQTQNVVILITGSAAGWCQYSEEYVREFALQRATNIQFALIQGAGIPAPLISVYARVGTLSCDPAINQADRYVRIEVKINPGSLR